jgi:hypothetical protein
MSYVPIVRLLQNFCVQWWCTNQVANNWTSSFNNMVHCMKSHLIEHILKFGCFSYHPSIVSFQSFSFSDGKSKFNIIFVSKLSCCLIFNYKAHNLVHIMNINNLNYDLQRNVFLLCWYALIYYIIVQCKQVLLQPIFLFTIWLTFFSFICLWTLGWSLKIIWPLHNVILKLISK